MGPAVSRESFRQRARHAAHRGTWRFGIASACNQTGTQGVFNHRSGSPWKEGEPDYFCLKRRQQMKKRVLGIALAIVSMGFVVSAEAKTTDVSQVNSTLAANAVPQWQRDRYG